MSKTSICVHIFLDVFYDLLSGTGSVSAHPDVHDGQKIG